MEPLTESQLAFLQDNAQKFWDVFVASDPDLLTSTCDCCREKRELARTVCAPAVAA